MEASFLKRRKSDWYVTEATTSVSGWIVRLSLASTAWCTPSPQRRPSITRPENSSMMSTCKQGAQPAGGVSGEWGGVQALPRDKRGVVHWGPVGFVFAAHGR